MLGRKIGHVIVGALSDHQPSKPYLLHAAELEATNKHTIARIVNDALTILWPNGIEFDRFLLLLTDSAAYMIAAAAGLQVYLFKCQLFF